MKLKVLNSVVVALTLLLWSRYSLAINSITDIAVAIGTSEEKGSNLILSVRVKHDGWAWGPWKPELTTSQYRVDSHNFVDDIVCVTSGVDLFGLRLLRFCTRKKQFIVIKSDFSEYHSFIEEYPRYVTFSFKGYPLIDIQIDTSPSRIKTFWNHTTAQYNNPTIVLDSGSGIFREYLIKTDRDALPPNDTCYWSDESVFRGRGHINAVVVEAGTPAYKEYNMALSVRYGQSWQHHGYHERGLSRYSKNISQIVGFVYNYSAQVISFATKENTYTFRTGGTLYRTVSLFGENCTIAYFTGYMRMHRKPPNPWLLRPEILYKNGTVLQVDPYWMCVIPNKTCEISATGEFVCSCIQGFVERERLCLKACRPSIPDQYLDMEILENMQCPIEPGSYCSVETCSKHEVNFTCHDGFWELVEDTTPPTVSPHPINARNCHRECSLDPTFQKCVVNKYRKKTCKEINYTLSDAILQLQKAIQNCYEQGKAECQKAMFRCNLGYQKVPMSKVCDHEIDCDDGSDEVCGVKNYKELFDGFLASLFGLLNIFSDLAGVSVSPDDVINKSDKENCEWTKRIQIRDECDTTCGDASRKRKTDKKFSFGRSCKTSEKTRKRSCEYSNRCLECRDPKCKVDVQFNNFTEAGIITELQKHVYFKSIGGKIKFSTNFRSNTICSCKITKKSYLKCDAKMKGRTNFKIKVENEVPEELTLIIIVAVGDFHVEFIKHRLFFENFLKSLMVNATDLASDKDKEDEIEFTRVEFTDEPGKDILIREEKKITSLFFQIGEFFSGNVNCTITVSSGGFVATSVVELSIGKNVHCPTCKKGDPTCQNRVIYNYYDFDQEESVKYAMHLMQPNGKRKADVQVADSSLKNAHKRRKIILGCLLPYNNYFKQWLDTFQIAFEPSPLLDATPYVLNGDKNTGVVYVLQSGERVNVHTQKVYVEQIESIYTEGVKNMTNITREFIDKLDELKLIGFATLYKIKPGGISAKLNIQFDHIPPASAVPPSANTEEEKKIYKNNAPTLAISNFDHRSEVWKNCSTGNPKIHNLYSSFMKNWDYKCAIFANLKCIRDTELRLPKDEVLYDDKNKTAFERYKDGFKGLVNLHFDYGTNFNYAYKAKSPVDANRPFAAYCELKKPDVSDPAAECNKNCVIESSGTQNFYYKFGPKKCETAQGKKLKTERNILRKDRRLLTHFIDGVAEAEKDLWNKCCKNPRYKKTVQCKKYLPEPQ